MPKPRGFSHFRKISGAHIGKIAIKIFECNGCHAQFKGEKPVQCGACGRMDFKRIDSKQEAKRLAELRMLLAAGKIENLETQVRFPLMAARSDGLPVKVATYIADFVYHRAETGERIIEDTKSAGVMSDVAALKLRWMEAQGLPVTIVTEKGRF